MERELKKKPRHSKNFSSLTGIFRAVIGPLSQMRGPFSSLLTVEIHLAMIYSVKPNTTERSCLLCITLHNTTHATLIEKYNQRPHSKHEQEKTVRRRQRKTFLPPSSTEPT